MVVVVVSVRGGGGMVIVVVAVVRAVVSATVMGAVAAVAVPARRSCPGSNHRSLSPGGVGQRQKKAQRRRSAGSGGGDFSHDCSGWWGSTHQRWPRTVGLASIPPSERGPSSPPPLPQSASAWTMPATTPAAPPQPLPSAPSVRSETRTRRRAGAWRRPPVPAAHQIRRVASQCLADCGPPGAAVEGQLRSCTSSIEHQTSKAICFE